jgi:vanillate O-demethylase monooxygenase subunit
LFLRNYWYIAATADEVSRALIQRWILGVPVLLYRTEAGLPVALEDVCPHRSLPLSMGALVGDAVRCGYHGITFATDGKCIRIPGQDHIAPRWKVASFPIVEKWRFLWIWMGDAEKADPAAIPDFHWNDDPAWIPTGGHLPIRCHYQLLVDNLLDLSHLAFVHPTTIGNDAVAENPLAVSQKGDEVHMVRQMPACPAPPLYVKLRGYSGEIDRSQDIVFSPPSNVVIASLSVPRGSADSDLALEYYVLNGITPGTDNSCHHFWAVSRNCAPAPEVTAAFREGALRAFNEDVIVLEKQQAMIDAQGGIDGWLHSNADAGGMAARRVVDRLLRDASRN